METNKDKISQNAIRSGILITGNISDKENYDKVGYEIYKNHINKDKIKLMNDVIDYLEKTLTVSDSVFDENGTGKIKQIQYLHTRNTIFADLVEELRPLAEYLIGESNLEVLNMQLFEKHPGISKPTRAHQDNAYFKMYPTTPLTIWIALDDIDEENGCVYYAPYTHLNIF